MARILRNIVDTTWTPSFAYAIGLLVSDGYVHVNTKRVVFSSRDKQLVELYKSALNLHHPISSTGLSGTSGKRGWQVQFKSAQFHEYLVQIGISPAKSKTISKVLVPDEFFADFVRGIFDGDGTFYSWKDRRWKRAFSYHIEIASASPTFLQWLQENLARLYGLKGFIKNGKGVYILRYAKGDTFILAQKMYTQPTKAWLQRKYSKIQLAIDFDQKLKQTFRT